jgi:shikimate dehydrogenase
MTREPMITGRTRLYAIVGDPIVQVKSPEVFTARFAAAGWDAVLLPAHVPASRFDEVVPALMALGNLDGLLVTVPFKPRAVALAGRLGVTARTIGALNALRRERDGSWTGDMFDGAGFVRGAERKGQRVRGRRVALLGAGGAGSAIACALAEAGVRSLAIVDIDRARAETLVARLRPAFPACEMAAVETLPAEADLVVNATPVGMQPGDGIPGGIGALDEGTLVGDVVIVDTPTALIRHAERQGCPWVDGRDMHAGQVEAIVNFFEASRPVDRQSSMVLAKSS